MSWKYLGETFDIHGGGVDLVFPHHEDEIAQSRCAFHTPVMANYWMHNGFLQVEGEKMSKSLGNFVTINELLTNRKFGSNKWHGNVLRLAMLMTHYRQPIDWTVERLVEARRVLREWIDAAIGFEEVAVDLPHEFLTPLLDDLNTPSMISTIHGLYRDARPRVDALAGRQLAAALLWLGVWQGESSDEIYSYGYEVRDGPSHVDVELLIEARNAARKAKDFKESDRIRDELAAMGVVLKDSKEGTTWEIVR